MGGKRCGPQSYETISWSFIVNWLWNSWKIFLLGVRKHCLFIKLWSSNYSKNYPVSKLYSSAAPRWIKVLTIMKCIPQAHSSIWTGGTLTCIPPQTALSWVLNSDFCSASYPGEVSASLELIGTWPSLYIHSTGKFSSRWVWETWMRLYILYVVLCKYQKSRKIFYVVAACPGAREFQNSYYLLSASCPPEVISFVPSSSSPILHVSFTVSAQPLSCLRSSSSCLPWETHLLCSSAREHQGNSWQTERNPSWRPCVDQWWKVAFLLRGG